MNGEHDAFQHKQLACNNLINLHRPSLEWEYFRQRKFVLLISTAATLLRKTLGGCLGLPLVYEGVQIVARLLTLVAVVAICVGTSGGQSAATETGSPVVTGYGVASQSAPTDSPPVPTANDQENQILKLAQEYLTDQANTVTENQAANRNLGTNQLPLDRITGPLVEVLRQEAPVISARRDQWRGTPSEHDWAKVTMLYPKIIVARNTATMTVTEHTELHYTFEEPSTSYKVGHRMGFVRVGDTWKIERDDLDLPPGTPDLLEPYHRAFLTVGNIARTAPGVGSTLDPQGVETPESVIGGVSVPGQSTSRVRLLASAAEQPGTYNGNAAADYAEAWALRRNPDYPEYENDCTNFASQVLRVGGWQDDADNEWYAEGGPLGSFQRKFASTGDAWRLADGLLRYGRDVSHRFTVRADGKDSRRGDIVFADWTNASGQFGTDGKMDHAMVVTNPGNGLDWRDVRVSYHTTDRLNIRMADVASVRAAGADPGLQRFYFVSP